MSDNNKKLNAAQRLESLENAMALVDKTIHELFKSVENLRLAGKTLSNKVDSIISASSQGQQINDDIINKIMIENNVSELKERIEKLKASNQIIDGSEIGDMSLMVLREIDPDTNEVANPRVQIAFQLLAEPTKELLKGKKAGDIISMGENKLNIEVLEVYNIVIPEAQKEVNS
jgi:uncharacterized coiled-coil protein SlyX